VSTTPDFPVFLALVAMTVDGGERHMLMTDRQGVLTAFKSAREGLDHFEGGYRAGHGRSYEGSMSACINWMQFRPTIVSFESMDDIYKAMGPGPYKLNSVQSIAGYMSGVFLPAENVEALTKRGVTPRLT
jgi:hypothetical protein